MKSQLKCKVLYKILQVWVLDFNSSGYYNTFCRPREKRVILQLINYILRAFQKLLRYFNGSITWTSFVSFFIIVYNWNYIIVIIIFYNWNYSISIFSMIYLCIIYFIYAIRKWSTIFKYYFFVSIFWICTCSCRFWDYYSFFTKYASITIIT